MAARRDHDTNVGARSYHLFRLPPHLEDQLAETIADGGITACESPPGTTTHSANCMDAVIDATDYSIANTARHVLWIPMPGEVTYKGKPTVDTLFVRLGDGLAALTVLVGVQLLGLAVAGYFVLNIGLVVVWVGRGG